VIGHNPMISQEQMHPHYLSNPRMPAYNENSHFQSQQDHYDQTIVMTKKDSDKSTSEEPLVMDPSRHLARINLPKNKLDTG